MQLVEGVAVHVTWGNIGWIQLTIVQRGIGGTGISGKGKQSFLGTKLHMSGMSVGKTTVCLDSLMTGDIFL